MDEPRSAAGLVLITITALVMAVAVGVLPSLAGQPGDGVGLNAWTEFLGNLHPVVLHLPIGIFVVVFAMEILGWLSMGKWKPQTTVPLFLGVVSAVVAVVCGYFLYLQGDRGRAEVNAHLWGSIAFAVIGILAFLAKLWAGHNEARSPIYGILLLIAMGTLGWSSHEGGEMTHGDPFGPFIASLKADGGQAGGNGGGPAGGGEPAGGAAAAAAVAAAKPVEERLAYEEVIVPILRSKCYECHADADQNPLGRKKIKGKLVMTSMEGLLKGGASDEPAVTPGSLEDSYMVYTIELPIDEDEHMPPEDKDQLEEHEIEIIKWWIVAGAPAGKSLKDAGASAAILAAAGKLESPEVLKEQADAAAAARAQEEAAAEAKRKELEGGIAEVSAAFPNALRYVSQESTDLTFTAVSIRKDFGDEQLAKLAPVAGGLVELEIDSTQVTDAGLEHLKPMTGLRKLKLNGTAVTDAGLPVVGGLGELTYLNLVGTAVTDQGLKSLEGLQKLEKLYLWQSQATKEGAEALKQVLPGCEINLGVE